MIRVALAFDYGQKNIGIAVGQTLTGTAQALKTITSKNKRINWGQITFLVNEWDPEIFIVGLPTLKTGYKHALKIEIEKFSRRLTGRYRRPVEFVDERLSSRAAVNYAEEVQQTGLDAVAAKLILETWLQERTGTLL